MKDRQKIGGGEIDIGYIGYKRQAGKRGNISEGLTGNRWGRDRYRLKKTDIGEE